MYKLQMCNNEIRVVKVTKQGRQLTDKLGLQVMILLQYKDCM